MLLLNVQFKKIHGFPIWFVLQKQWLYHRSNLSAAWICYFCSTMSRNILQGVQLRDVSDVLAHSISKDLIDLVIVVSCAVCTNCGHQCLQQCAQPHCWFFRDYSLISIRWFNCTRFFEVVDFVVRIAPKLLKLYLSDFRSVLGAALQ